MNLNHKRLLIVKPSSMGDVIHALPVAHAIKRVYPQSTIGWVIQNGLESFLECDPAIDEIIRISIPSTSDPNAAKGAYLAATKATVRELGRLRRIFRSKPYDVVLDMHASFRSGLISISNPDCRRYGLEDAKELNTFFQDQLVCLDLSKPHAVDKNLAFLPGFGIEPAQEDFRLSLSSDVIRVADKFLSNLNLPAGKMLVYANPAARWKTKMWFDDGWARLLRLVSDSLDAAILIGGGPADAGHIDRILNAAGSQWTINMAGKLNPVESAAVMSRCSAYVGVDSGPMHIAAFLGIPVVALFGPTDPAKVGPYSSQSKIVRKTELDCLACRKSACRNLICMNKITADEVFEALQFLLQKVREHQLGKKNVNRVLDCKV